MKTLKKAATEAKKAYFSILAENLHVCLNTDTACWVPFASTLNRKFWKKITALNYLKNQGQPECTEPS